jgi:enamine deaminase RidA (YjgF/YER057c/UK114 family)
MPIEQRVGAVAGLPVTDRYSYAVTVSGRLAFLAGQVAADAEGRLVGPGDLAAQTAQALTNLYAVIRELGAGWPDVVRFNWYLTDVSQVATVREVRARLMGADSPPPASTLVQVAGLASPDYLVEVDAVVALPG